MQAVHQRHLTDFLRREYGVEHVAVEGRSKHNKLIWLYHNKTFSYLVSRGTDGDYPRAMQNAKSAIRRMMGKPPHIILQRKSMSDTMDEVRERAIADIVAPEPPTPDEEPQPAPARTWRIRIWAYRPHPNNKPCLMLAFPPQIMESLPTFEIAQLDAEHWKLRRGGKRTWRLQHNRKWVRAGTMLNTDDLIASMMVDAVEADGEVLVYIPLADRREPGPSRWKEREEEVEETEPVPPMIEQRAAIEMAIAAKSGPVEFRMREILRQVREIESITPYHLSREGDRLSWQAPVIE